MLRSAEDLKYDWRDQLDGRWLRATHEKAFRETGGGLGGVDQSPAAKRHYGCTATRDLLSSMKRVLSYWRISQG
jgi:hypothetical protein